METARARVFRGEIESDAADWRIRLSVAQAKCEELGVRDTKAAFDRMRRLLDEGVSERLRAIARWSPASEEPDRFLPRSVLRAIRLELDALVSHGAA